MKRPTQADVARLAGVSKATVSYVINGLSNGRISISEETRRRVMKAVEELGYEPDTRARALRSGGTKTIGLVIPDTRNPHFWDNVSGIEQEVRDAGYHLLLSSLGLENEYGDLIYKDLTGQRIDGLILMGSYIDQSTLAREALDLLLKRGLAVVEISDRPNVDHKVDRVVADYSAATVEIMDYLFSLHHRRIGLINGVAMPDLAQDRLRPYRAYLQSAGLPVEEDLLIHCGPTLEDGYQAARQLLARPRPPTAIIAINDILAIGALRAAADLGLHVPHDVSLVGFDDIFSANYLVPRLTTVTKDAFRLGQEAVRLVLARIKDPSRPLQKMICPARVILRESTGPAPGAGLPIN